MRRGRRWSWLLLTVFSVVVARAPGVAAQVDTAPPSPGDAPGRVEIKPAARDDEIRRRLEEILEATGWFVNPRVHVQNGVVFIEGRTESDASKNWAGDLARNTADVAVVVNRLEIRKPLWDFRPALASLHDLWRGLIGSLPLLLVAALTLLLSWFLARLVAHSGRRLLRHRRLTPFLRDVVARALATVVFIAGLYVVLRVAGLTTIALTVMGGTGLVGLALGIAFRNITENFLASVFLSLQRPFRSGDLVEMAGYVGYVQRLTNRATLLMTLDGNHVQIPNTTVYQSAICNYTSNPNRRDDFCIGIGYADSIPRAQEIALQVLLEHPAVLAEPEPWVLVDSLGQATVVLRVYFWIDGSRHSWLKVRSSVMRLVKRAFQDANVSMPDEARELVFPEAVPVQLLNDRALRRTRAEPSRGAPTSPRSSPEGASSPAEAALGSEADSIESQARRARLPEPGENLL